MQRFDNQLITLFVTCMYYLHSFIKYHVSIPVYDQKIVTFNPLSSILLDIELEFLQRQNLFGQKTNKHPDLPFFFWLFLASHSFNCC